MNDYDLNGMDRTRNLSPVHAGKGDLAYTRLFCYTCFLMNVGYIWVHILHVLSGKLQYFTKFTIASFRHLNIK